MSKTIYEYKDDLEEGVSSISQGDIFSNLPYFSYDKLFKSEPTMIQKFGNENKEIFEEIIHKECKIQIEGFMTPSWGILASQDCDIKPNKDLIFLPLIKTKPLKTKKNIIESVDNKIKNSARRLYIPQLKLRNIAEYGPFEIIFHNPFNVPYNIIKKNLDKCWKARLIEPACKIFLGKLANFYTRTPIDEFIFLENTEITKYIKQYWNKFWKKGKNIQSFQEKIKKVKEIIDLLIFIKRKDDIKKIFFYDLEFVKRVKNVFTHIKLDKKAQSLVKICINIDKFYERKPDYAQKEFEELITNYCLSEDSFLSQYELLMKSQEELKKIRIGDFVPNILPPYITQEEAKEYADNIIDNKNLINNIPNFIYKYLEIRNYINEGLSNLEREQ